MMFICFLFALTLSSLVSAGPTRPPFSGDGSIRNTSVVSGQRKSPAENFKGNEDHLFDGDKPYSTATTHENIQIAVYLLRSFVEGPYTNPKFNDGAFSQNSDYLGELFAQIVRSYKQETEESPSEALTAEYLFSGQIYAVMAEAYYQGRWLSDPSFPKPVTAMIEKMIAFRIYLFKFYDNFGVADPTVDKYAEVVSFYVKQLPVWKEEFQALGEKRSYLQQSFQRQLYEMEVSVGILSRYIAKK
ncbi:hypothetical protein JCM33374_g4405 [Metschnikowia sp. JCM 33374]|nr:hypothetical protein JCM33374_g4405 [Metschnikowia sp. JCM 33374]